MRTCIRLAAMAALCLAASAAHADGQGFGVCKTGFEDGTVVSTESHGQRAISELEVGDRVWSLNEVAGKEGWSRVLRRQQDAGPHYKILADFTDPDTSEVTKACWIIKTAH